ncbi:GNAT family N-acetyltransferase [Staphylococcus durrellii]|uniref:GNAT family N-acetyltransferase n=1 Tax=Staphylococcus durrellii TaxID=2781773 RepID=UPI00189CF087|nr:GNAT family N-acetyltransferase [Staphylococcus durrellii]MBF7017703.1 GNAT family N-acetyltransferase [Staphylococcus durrellii]
MRKLKLEDKQIINQIAYIHERELAEQNNAPRPTNFAVSLREEMIIRRINYMSDAIYINLIDGNLAGFIWGHFQKENKVVVIEMLYVAHNYRKQHIASLLKTTIENWAIDNHAHKIIGTIHKNNTAMFELNNKLGYATEKLIMTKDLTTLDEQLKE